MVAPFAEHRLNYSVITETGKKRLIMIRRVNYKERSVAMANIGGELGRFGVIG